MKNVKPLFNWAKANGDSNIYDRILIKAMPEFLKENLKLTSHSIETSNKIEISDELYTIVLKKTEELVGAKYV